MAPIRKGDGTTIVPKGIAEVRKGDGTVLYSAGSAIPDSAVARWTFDDADTQSGSAVDVWNGNDATINGAATGVSGANQTYTTNEAYSFDGTDDYIDTPVGDDDFGSNNEFTLACWINFSSDGDLLSTFDGSAGVIVRPAGSEWRFFLSDSVSNSDLRGGSASAGSWYHICATFDGSNQTLYVDGSDVGSTTTSADPSSTANLMISNRPSSSETLSGTVDDPRVYNKAISATDVSNLYNNGSIEG